MNRMTGICLSEEEKQVLAELAKTGPDLITHRARLILAYAEGKPTLHASTEAGISRGRARFWKRQFIAHGMGIFHFASKADLLNKERIATGLADMPSSPSETESLVSSHAAAATVMEIPFPEPREKIGISPDDLLAEAGRKVWLYYFAQMISHEEGTLLGENIEELHDMRVATRRMRTAFDIFGPAFDAKTMKRQLKGLRTIGRVLGQVRDMDVLYECAQASQRKLKENDLHGFEPLLTEWSAIIRKRRSKMIEHLKSQEFQDFKHAFNRFLQTADTVETGGRQTNAKDSLLRDAVPVLVYSRYAAVRAYEANVYTASVAQLHALRIEFKKFRYTLEYFKEILGDGIGPAINELKQLQDHLGELHDADVGCQLVRSFLKEWDGKQSLKPILERVNPEPIVSYLAYLHDERYRLTSSFPTLWRRFSRTEFRQRIAQAISQL